MNNMELLEIKDLNKSFDNKKILKDIKDIKRYKFNYF